MRNVNRRSRINFSIKRKMQIRLFINCMLISVVAIGLMAVIFYFYSNREIGESYRQFHVQARNFLDYLLPAVLGAIVLGVIASILIAVFFPHKIAGPLYRIERDLKDRIGNGDLTVRFNLRKGDEVGDLAAALNETLEKLSSRIEYIKAPLEELESSTARGKNCSQEELRRLVKKIGEGVSEFKI